MLKLVSHSPRLNARLEKIKALVKDRGLDMLVVFRPENLFYLTGFRGGEGAILVYPDKASLAVDSRYEERAEYEAANVEIRGGRSVPSIIKDALLDLSPGKAGFEAGGLTFAEYEAMEAAAAASPSKVELIPVHGAVEGLRVEKDLDEIKDLQKAADIADSAMAYAAGEIKAGQTEIAIAEKIGIFLKDSGAEAESFDIIVASGANSSMPHAASTEKKIERGDLVLADLGAVVNGYHSDLTRTFVVGKARPEQAAMHDAVAEAGRLVVKEMKPGQAAAEADEICRGFLDAYNGPAKLLHSLGHGVGLEIHERPQLGAGSTDELKNGMVFTVEPGLYQRGLGGVRIEDMILLDGKPSLMTRSPRDLIEL